ncbi:MAG: hypothetical protein WDW38_006964 [Sanguina aurantia]
MVLQRQSIERAEWAASVRIATGGKDHMMWEPQLDPPALLAQVTVVLVSPRRPVSVGTVARALSSFEVEDMRIVAPREDYVTNGSSSGSSSSSQERPTGSASSKAPLRIALVFGREELGLSDEEVSSCDLVTSIPIGRLQESLSLSHAVSITLAALYQQRLDFISSSAPAPAS